MDRELVLGWDVKFEKKKRKKMPLKAKKKLKKIKEGLVTNCREAILFKGNNLFIFASHTLDFMLVIEDF